jgi:hypothetical protein
MPVDSGTNLAPKYGFKCLCAAVAFSIVQPTNNHGQLKSTTAAKASRPTQHVLYAHKNIQQVVVVNSAMGLWGYGAGFGPTWNAGYWPYKFGGKRRLPELCRASVVPNGIFNQLQKNKIQNEVCVVNHNAFLLMKSQGAHTTNALFVNET